MSQLLRSDIPLASNKICVLAQPINDGIHCIMTPFRHRQVRDEIHGALLEDMFRHGQWLQEPLQPLR